MFLTEAEGDAYLALGVSTCFRRDDEGKLTEVSVIEPINATTLETMNIGKSPTPRRARAFRERAAAFLRPFHAGH